jgi:hypothetical protein
LRFGGWVKSNGGGQGDDGGGEAGVQTHHDQTSSVRNGVDLSGDLPLKG